MKINVYQCRRDTKDPSTIYVTVKKEDYKGMKDIHCDLEHSSTFLADYRVMLSAECKVHDESKTLYGRIWDAFEAMDCPFHRLDDFDWKKESYYDYQYNVDVKMGPAYDGYTNTSDCLFQVGDSYYMIGFGHTLKSVTKEEGFRKLAYHASANGLWLKNHEEFGLKPSVLWRFVK